MNDYTQITQDKTFAFSAENPSGTRGGGSRGGDCTKLSPTVTIPAGETVEVEAKYHQEASTDFHGAKQDRDGYDLATRLGSSLDFTEQSAAIKGWEFIEILRQNFGFRPNKGITEVTLDPDVERYYLEVTGK